MGRKQRVGILVFDGVKLLDVAGPSEVFSEANRFGADYEVALYSADGRDVASSTGMRIPVDAAAADAGHLETALVAGGDIFPTHPVSPELAEAARILTKRAGRTASICTGTFILAAAGLLDGRRATTHWQHARTLARAHPAIEVEPDAIYVEDGQIFSSAGVSAGIDLALALVERDHGAGLARDVARSLVVFLQRPGGQSQFSPSLRAALPRTSPVRQLCDTVAASPAGDYSLARLAAMANLSPRHLNRLFRDELKTTPARYVELIRFDTAKDLVDAGHSVTDAALRSGFGSAETLRRAFIQHLGVSPRAYQQRFRSAIRTGREHALNDSPLTAAEVLDGLPEPRRDGDSLRASIRAMRAEDGLLLGVLDDDPTGSQAVHGVEVVTVLEEEAYDAALAGPAATCFVLTNTRSMEEPDAAGVNVEAARGLLSVAGRRGARLQLVSRSDSTLRGHVMAEVRTLDSVRRETSGRGYDGVLLVPAFLEAGRLTAGDIHRARVSGRLVPVGETEFARDAAFGYTASNLRDFVAEKSGGTIGRDDVGSIGLTDIRLGGPQRVRELLAGVRDGSWVVVNATEYSDLETVAAGVLMAERAGASFLYRTGPSFLRALTGMGPLAPLRGADIWSAGGPAPGGHGLVVVGSHVGQTSRQLEALLARGGITAFELDVPAVVGGGGEAAARTARKVTAALRESDVLLYTSRAVATGRDGAGSLAIARTVSAALSGAVREALAARPAWVVAKGGITSHDVALHGLGIRRAEVAGQLFPGVISVLRPLDAAREAIGVPYVVFAGNVGDDGTLANVVAILKDERKER